MERMAGIRKRQASVDGVGCDGLRQAEDVGLVLPGLSDFVLLLLSRID